METNLTSNLWQDNQVKSIYEKLVRIRTEMHELEEHFGMIHELTVAKSQELDVVINEYMCIKFKATPKLIS